MSIEALAKDFTELCRTGQFEEAGVKYWADDVVSLENMDGPMREVRGKAAVKGKGDWWNAAHEVHDARVDGPFINGPQFAVRFWMDVTLKETGARTQMDEVGLYTVEGGKIVEERFFY
jgi:ketosteroid isomerase-like protein